MILLEVPLHSVHLVSDLMSGLIVAGVVPILSLKGVSMLLGNELAGGKVTIHRKVILVPVTSLETKKIEKKNSSLFPSCAVTQAQVKRRS